MIDLDCVTESARDRWDEDRVVLRAPLLAALEELEAHRAAMATWRNLTDAAEKEWSVEDGLVISARAKLAELEAL